MAAPNDIGWLCKELLDLLERLHRHKDAAYGDAWRKRGEVIAIFANLARKYDRLLVAFDEARPAAAEPLGDTVADLCVYAAKYLTWLAETHPDALVQADLPVRAAQVAANLGPDAAAAVFAALSDVDRDASEPGAPRRAWDDVQSTFVRLERGLMAQSTPGSPASDLLDWPSKATLAWTLADQCAQLLTVLAAQDHTLLDVLRSNVASMDAAACS